MKWYASGLVDIPAVMRKETKAYIQENDEIGEFLANTTEPEEGQFILSSRLYKKYCDWCHTQNSQAKGVKSFSQDMEKKYKKEHKRIGQVFVGLRFFSKPPRICKKDLWICEENYQYIFFVSLSILTMNATNLTNVMNLSNDWSPADITSMANVVLTFLCIIINLHQSYNHKYYKSTCCDETCFDVIINHERPQPKK
jgi:phage/plasmid-associated DNA primase